MSLIVGIKGKEILIRGLRTLSDDTLKKVVLAKQVTREPGATVFLLWPRKSKKQRDTDLLQS
jgi:hypothetical protein